MISKKNIPFLLLTSASMVAAVGCRATMNQSAGAGGGSSALMASVGGVTNESRDELEKGEFNLLCDNKDGILAVAKMMQEKVEFKLAQGKAVAAGDRCYVNVMRPDLGENANVNFPLGAGIYWGSSKGVVYAENQTMAIKFELFKAYSAKAGATAGASTVSSLDFVLQLSTASGPVIASGLFNVTCENESETLVARATIDGNLLKAKISAATKFIGKKCDLKFTTELEREDYLSEGKLTLAEANGAVEAPIVLHKSAPATVGVVAAIDMKGDCRVFSSDRSACQWVMPEACKLPLAEVSGVYEDAKWLACVAEAATVTNRMLSASVPQQQGSTAAQNRIVAQRIVQEMQNALRSWNQKQTADRPALIDTLIAEGQKVTASSGQDALNVRDEAVVYGLEKVILPVLSDVKANLGKAAQ